MAVRRVVENGEKPSVVMDSLGLCRTTIYPWLHEFKEKGYEALVEKICLGREPLLNSKQRAQVRRWVERAAGVGPCPNCV